MKKVNISQICSINVLYHCECERLVYQPAKTGLFKWLINQPEGFYFWLDLYPYKISKSKPMTREELLKKHENITVDQDNKVFYKPHIEVKTADGRIHERYFENKEALDEWLKVSPTSMIKWMDIK